MAVLDIKQAYGLIDSIGECLTHVWAMRIEMSFWVLDLCHAAPYEQTSHRTKDGQTIHGHFTSLETYFRTALVLDDPSLAPIIF